MGVITPLHIYTLLHPLSLSLSLYPLQRSAAMKSLSIVLDIRLSICVRETKKKTDFSSQMLKEVDLSCNCELNSYFVTGAVFSTRLSES